MIILSGDIGGTTTRIQLTDFASTGSINVIKCIHYNSNDYGNFIEVLDTFFTQTGFNRNDIAAVCFGVAGPIVGGVVQCTNLPWVIKVNDIKESLKLTNVALINDFVAIGYGLQVLQSKDLFTLQIGKRNIDGIQAYLGAGTGLGVGFITHDQGKYRVYPTEGGHIDFAPTDDIQIELLSFLKQKYHHVSFERVLSGPGLVNIYHFVRSYKGFSDKENSKLASLIDGKVHIDLAAAITEYAILHSDPLANKALGIFIRIYGAAVGNLALTTLPYGGLYIVGGIAPKLLPLISSKLFFDAFSDKGRMSDLIKDIPLYLVLNENVGLQGATLYAKQEMLP